MAEDKKDYDWSCALYHGISAIKGLGWCTIETNEVLRHVRIKISRDAGGLVKEICKAIDADLPGDIAMLGNSIYIENKRLYRWTWM
jgi:hypothetical protein